MILTGSSIYCPSYQNFRIFSQGRSNKGFIRCPLSPVPHLDPERVVVDSPRALKALTGWRSTAFAPKRERFNGTNALVFYKTSICSEDLSVE